MSFYNILRHSLRRLEKACKKKRQTLLRIVFQATFGTEHPEKRRAQIGGKFAHRKSQFDRGRFFG
jgi:hypothetical protein